MLIFNKFKYWISKRYLLQMKISRIFLTGFLLNFVFGFLFYFVEKTAQPELTVLDAMWWAMVTMTTVGYGDFYARTMPGRFLVSYPCMLVGIGMIGYLVSWTKPLRGKQKAVTLEKLL
jgi:voltage-gated potassium channel